MESSFRGRAGNFFCSSCSLTRKARKTGRFSSGSSVKGATVMSPVTSMCENVSIAETASSSDSGIKPDLLSSFATFTSRSIRAVSPFLPYSFSMLSARETESTEWMRQTFPGRYLTLFFCKFPIMWKCGRSSCMRGSSVILSYFSRISCTLFSPKSRIPHW